MITLWQDAAAKTFNSSGNAGATGSFGKNFVVPKRNSTTTFIKKKATNTIKSSGEVTSPVSEDERIRLIIANNPIKKMADEAALKQEQELKAKKDKLLSEYSVGDRVFHPRFGIGKIYFIDKDNVEPTVTVEFNKEGLKEFDLVTSGLKKF